MPSSIGAITLGVSDISSSIAFYRDVLCFPLGYHTETVAFFDLPGTRLALFQWQALEGESHANLQHEGTPPISLVRYLHSKEEVVSLVANALAGGATAKREPAPTCYGGLSGYIADPDGFLWEIVWDPNVAVD